MGKISIIVAIAEGDAIGKGNDLLCYISNDLKRFKRLTTGHPVIMGRKTFESLPNGPLPKRKNIVITRNSELKIEGCIMATSVEDAIEICKNEEESFVIGGGTIYEQFLPYADNLYLTKIHHKFDADCFFEVDLNKWEEIKREDINDDEKSPYNYSFIDLVKR